MKMVEEEFILIKKRLLLPLILNVLERDLSILKQSKIKKKIPYIKMFERVMDNVAKDLSSARLELKKKGISIIEESITSNGLKAVRKYHLLYHSVFYYYYYQQNL